MIAMVFGACGTDDVAPVPSDVEEAVDVAEVAEDIEPADAHWELSGNEDVEIPWDLPEVDLVEEDPDVQEGTPEVGFTGCPTLGVSPKWKGTFEGKVTYDLQGSGDEEPQQGLFLVGGELEFEIKCLDQKLLVSGILSGDAEAAGRIGVHPFAANLFGDFNYITREVDAKLLQGEVRVYKVISVFFEGNFDGAVEPDGTFRGTWDGVHTGNDLNMDGTATGTGKWTAFAVPETDDED